MKNAHYFACKYNKDKQVFEIYNSTNNDNSIMEVDSIKSYIKDVGSFDIIYYIDKG